MQDDTFEPAVWGKVFIISVVVFVLAAGAGLLEGYPLAKALTLALWVGPGFIVGMFFAAIGWRAWKAASSR